MHIASFFLYLPVLALLLQPLNLSSLKKPERVESKSNKAGRDALELPEIATKGRKADDFMKWRKPTRPASHAEVTLLRELLDKQHPLYHLAVAINW